MLLEPDIAPDKLRSINLPPPRLCWQQGYDKAQGDPDDRRSPATGDPAYL